MNDWINYWLNEWKQFFNWTDSIKKSLQKIFHMFAMTSCLQMATHIQWHTKCWILDGINQSGRQTVSQSVSQSAVKKLMQL